MLEFDKETRWQAILEHIWIGSLRYIICLMNNAEWFHRFYCTFLGRWSLIPKHYFNVQLPSETPYIASSECEAPTRFTDVIIRLTLSQSMQWFLSAPAQSADRLNSRVVACHAQKLKEIIVTLHPSFRMDNPDTCWDSMIPTLPLKKAEFIAIYGVLEGKGHSSSIRLQAKTETLRYRKLTSTSRSFLRVTSCSYAQKFHRSSHALSLTRNPFQRRRPQISRSPPRDPSQHMHRLHRLN